MTNQEITPFLFEGEALVRVVSLDSEPWFVAADVCRILGLSNPSKSVSSLEKDEVRTYTLTGSEGTPGNPTVNIISEPGYYRLTFRSNKPIAKRLTRWLAHEVLPSIRKTGRYEAQTTVIPPAGDQVQDIALVVGSADLPSFMYRAGGLGIQILSSPGPLWVRYAIW